MKEATGELNITVITVVALIAIAAFFYAFVWPVVKTNLERATKCSAANCPATCNPGDTCTCSYTDDAGSEESVTCVMKDHD